MAYFEFEPMRALRAARTLAADPDDLPQVFTIIESLSLGTLARVTRRLGRSTAGRSLLGEKPDIVARLADRDALARLPEGSLGRAYLAFVQKEDISPDGIRRAGKAGSTRRDAIPAPMDWVHDRMRDTHDLWHAVTGYSGDVLGETALLAFTFAQVFNPAIGLIIAIGLAKTVAAPSGGDEARRTIFEGYRRGQRAKWLLEQPWESMLALPVEDVRRRLSIDPLTPYREIRSAEIKAQAA
jgi:ubiquinone biosynthesis protein COQ4